MPKKPAVKKPRNYAATESTLINLRALKKRLTALEDKVATVSLMVEQMLTRLA